MKSPTSPPTTTTATAPTPSTKPLEEHVSVRLGVDVLARIDAVAAQLAPFGSRPLRSVAVRALILTGLDTFEAKGGSR
ncbi:MAG: hypothetical protein U0359_19195 [Byssovorax sp.]